MILKKKKFAWKLEYGVVLMHSATWKGKKSRPAQRKDLYVCGWRKMRGEEHSNFNLSYFGWKGKKRNKIQNDPGTSLFFLFLLRRMAPVFSPFFFLLPSSLFAVFFFLFIYSPNSSFIILFPLLWAAGQYNIRKCSNSDPLFNIYQSPPIVSETLGGGTWGQPLSPFGGFSFYFSNAQSFTITRRFWKYLRLSLPEEGNHFDLGIYIHI